MINATIPVRPLIGNTLDTRDEAIRLFNALKDYCPMCGDITLDFKDVQFMSRSFADQFHKEKIKWYSESKLIIHIINDSTQMHEILKAVAKTQKSADRVQKSEGITIKHISKPDQIYKYLQLFN